MRKQRWTSVRVVVLAVALVSGCAPTTYVHPTKVSTAEWEQDLTYCRAEALAAVSRAGPDTDGTAGVAVTYRTRRCLEQRGWQAQ